MTTPHCSEPFGTFSLSLCLREYFGSKAFLLQLQSIQAIFFLGQQPEDTKANGNALFRSEFIFIIPFLRLSSYFNILLSSFHTNRTASILRLPVQRWVEKRERERVWGRERVVWGGGAQERETQKGKGKRKRQEKGSHQ